MDESVPVGDGDYHMPCLLVQTKSDLLSEEEENIDELNEFSQNNGFIECFRTSSKTGKNISESMEFLIKNVIKQMEELNSKGIDYKTERQSVALDPDKHNKEADLKRKKEGGCC